VHGNSSIGFHHAISLEGQLKNRIQHYTYQTPILTGVVLMLIALLFRCVDIFVLKLDERWGEIILSKSLGFGLVLLFLWSVARKPEAIGLHTRCLGWSLLLGILITLGAFAAGYAVEWGIAHHAGAMPRLLLAAIDPKAGVTGGLGFALWLVVGNFVNAFMEEGLFRGVMLNLYYPRLSRWQANWLQAGLFGAWHLVWVVKWYQTGQVTTPGEIAFGVVANFLPQLLLGLVWGYAYLKTDNLWTVWIAHTLTNSVLNLLHVAVAEGLDGGLSIRMTVFSLVSLLLMLLIRYLGRQWKLPELQGWNISGRRAVRVNSPTE